MKQSHMDRGGVAKHLAVAVVAFAGIALGDDIRPPSGTAHAEAAGKPLVIERANEGGNPGFDVVPPGGRAPNVASERRGQGARYRKLLRQVPATEDVKQYGDF